MAVLEKETKSPVIHRLMGALGRSFPMPGLVFPRAAGVDISDSSIKWIALTPFASGYRVDLYGEEKIAPGLVVNGAIKDVEALGQVLRKVKQQMGGIVCAHAALPEEAGYIFEMHIPEGTSRSGVLNMIEFEFEGRVPIAPSAAVFDYDVIHHDAGAGQDIAVVVFPRDLAESYAAAFERAGITLLSLETEARSIARAVSVGSQDEPITLLVDFGRARTGFAVLKRGIPIFTSTVDVGGDRINRALAEKLSLSPEQIAVFKNEQGLRASRGARLPGLDIIVGTASVLGDEVARHYHYWDTRRNENGDRVTPVERVILVGGSSNLNGLPEYIAGRVQAPAAVGDVWQHVCDFNEYIPPIDRGDSLQYATSIGLALRSLV